MKMYTANGEEKLETINARERSSFRHTGGASTEIWYVANLVNNTTLTTKVIVADILYAVPFIAPARGGILDRLGLICTVAAVGNVRIALYTNTSDQTLYPATRLEESGNISTNVTTLLSHTISQQLVPGHMYWVAAVFSATPTIRAASATGVSHVLGTSSTLGTAPNTHLTVGLAFAQPPSTFTASGALQTTVAPAFAVRFSG